MKVLDVIWNVSLVCPWNCEFCCTDAAYVHKDGASIIVSDNGLRRFSNVSIDLGSAFSSKYPCVKPSVYDLALLERQAQGRELTLDQKLIVLDGLRGFDVRLDFAGGDPLACYENFIVIKRASEIFGRDSISVTSTGHSLGRYRLHELAEITGTFEFTYDEVHTENPSARPRGYNSSNLKAAERFANQGVRTKAQLPLHPGNISNEQIENIYRVLSSSGIDELLIMRTFPVGRGGSYLDKVHIKKEDIVAAIGHYRSLQAENGPVIRLQCALKHLFPMENSANPCDLMHESFGINYQGLLLLSAWANDASGKPLDESFVLGDLTKQTFSEISKTERFQTYQTRLDENYGHCKIFSFVHSSDKSAGIFQASDPLYLI